MSIKKLLSVETFIIVAIFILCESLTVSFAHCQQFARRWTYEDILVPASDSSRDVVNLSRYKMKEIYYRGAGDLNTFALKAVALVKLSGVTDTLKTVIKFKLGAAIADSVSAAYIYKLECEACDRIVFYTSWGGTALTLRIYKYTDQ